MPGATLRARFGLFDTWAYFTAIRSEPAPAPTATPAPSGGIGPAGAALAARRSAARGLRGSVLPARKGARITVQRRVAGRWILAARARVGAAGRYRVGLPIPGTYRVRHAGAAGPAVRLS